MDITYRTQPRLSCSSVPCESEYPLALFTNTPRKHGTRYEYSQKNKVSKYELKVTCVQMRLIILNQNGIRQVFFGLLVFVDDLVGFAEQRACVDVDGVEH